MRQRLCLALLLPLQLLHRHLMLAGGLQRALCTTTTSRLPIAHRHRSHRPMALRYPQPLVLEPAAGNATQGTVIFLHGLGACGCGHGAGAACTAPAAWCRGWLCTHMASGAWARARVQARALQRAPARPSVGRMASNLKPSLQLVCLACCTCQCAHAPLALHSTQATRARGGLMWAPSSRRAT